MKQFLFNIDIRCLSIISMHQMDLKINYCLMLMTVSIGILLKVLENGLWILLGGDYM